MIIAKGKIIMLPISSRIFIISVIWRLNNGFVLQHTHKNHLGSNGNEDFSVDLDIKDEDYEMISDKDLNQLNINFNEDKFEEINSIVSEEYKKYNKLRCTATEVKGNECKSKIIDKVDETDAPEVVATIQPIHTLIKRDVIKTGLKMSDLSTKGKAQEDSEPMVVTNIYYAVKAGKFESGFRILDCIKEIISLDMSNNCTADDSKGIGLKAIKCLLEDYLEKRQPYNILAVRFWNIAIIWLLVYLAVAIPLWCTRGWCCCCLCCKFFKPQETIQEAKNYLLLNPPGTLVTKRGGIIHYEPTEREKDCYEEFGHFIRTL